MAAANGGVTSGGRADKFGKTYCPDVINNGFDVKFGLEKPDVRGRIAPTAGGSSRKKAPPLGGTAETEERGCCASASVTMYTTPGWCSDPPWNGRWRTGEVRGRFLNSPPARGSSNGWSTTPGNWIWCFWIWRWENWTAWRLPGGCVPPIRGSSWCLSPATQTGSLTDTVWARWGIFSNRPRGSSWRRSWSGPRRPCTVIWTAPISAAAATPITVSPSATSGTSSPTGGR